MNFETIRNNSPIDTEATETINLPDKNIVITVKQHLPFSDKVDIVNNIINATIDDKGYYTTYQLEMNAAFYVIMGYTDIELDDEQSVQEFYDYMNTSGLYTEIVHRIPRLEYSFILENALGMIKNIYDYKNSIYAMVEGVNKNLKFDEETLTKIQQGLSDENSLTLVKNILDKMG